jgi:hypothetical protein
MLRHLWTFFAVAVWPVIVPVLPVTAAPVAAPPRRASAGEMLTASHIAVWKETHEPPVCARALYERPPANSFISSGLQLRIAQ